MNKLSKTINPEAIEDRSISFSKLKYDVSEGIASNLKTVGGQSLLGEGDIPISGGSSGNGAYSEIDHGTGDITFALTPNTFHIWDEVSTLTLTLGTETAGIANEFLFQFTSGSTATTLSLPSDLKWANDEFPVIEDNKIYQISILKGLASVLVFDNEATESLITFTIGGTEYQAEDGMTWEDWVNSKYNPNNQFIIEMSNIKNTDNARFVIDSDNGYFAVNISDVIKSGHEYFYANF